MKSGEKTATAASWAPADADRFWSKVDRSGGPGACWPWSGCVNAKGYGKFGSTRQRGWRLAHRVAFELTYGPPRHHVCHRCDNPPRCNPAHLVDGDAAANSADREHKGRGNHPTGATGNHGRAYLVPTQIVEIRRLRKAGVPTAVVARQVSTSVSNVGNIVARRSRRHVTDDEWRGCPAEEN